MEKQLFDWERWDDMGEGGYQFYGCTLVQPVGPYPVGEKVESIFVDYLNGVMAFYRDGAETDKFSLKLSVSETLPV